MPNSPSSFCVICRKSHDGLPTDTAYTLPDDVWAIPVEERASRATWTTDLCQLGERYFIRGFLPIPFTERAGSYGWGVWVEVESSAFERYRALYDQDARQEPTVSGHLANRVPVHEGSLGLPILVQFEDRAKRPTITFPPGSHHSFALEQEHGINEARFHTILVATGAIDAPTLVPMAEHVECAEHGRQDGTFVCQHLLRSLGTRERVGFFFTSSPRGDAWCAACEEVRIREGGDSGDWNDRSEAFAGVKLICGACYDEVRRLHEL
jgi:hypothetical protein